MKEARKAVQDVYKVKSDATSSSKVCGGGSCRASWKGHLTVLYVLDELRWLFMLHLFKQHLPTMTPPDALLCLPTIAGRQPRLD